MQAEQLLAVVEVHLQRLVLLLVGADNQLFCRESGRQRLLWRRLSGLLQTEISSL